MSICLKKSTTFDELLPKILGAILVFAMGIALSASVFSVVSVKAMDTVNKRLVLYYRDNSIWNGQSDSFLDQMTLKNVTNLNFSFLDFDEKGNLQLRSADLTNNHIRDGSSCDVEKSVRLLKTKYPKIK